MYLLNFNVHQIIQQSLLKYRFWFSKSGVEPEILYFNKLPEVAIAANPMITLWIARHNCDTINAPNYCILQSWYKELSFLIYNQHSGNMIWLEKIIKIKQAWLKPSTYLWMAWIYYMAFFRTFIKGPHLQINCPIPKNSNKMNLKPPHFFSPLIKNLGLVLFSQIIDI